MNFDTLRKWVDGLSAEEQCDYIRKHVDSRSTNERFQEDKLHGLATVGTMQVLDWFCRTRSNPLGWSIEFMPNDECYDCVVSEMIGDGISAHGRSKLLPEAIFKSIILAHRQLEHWSMRA